MAKYHYREAPTEKQRKAFAKYLSEDEELVLVTSFSRAYIRSKFVMYLLFPGMLFFGIGLGIGWLLGLEESARMWAFFLAIFLMILAAILRTMHIYHANRYLLTTRRVIFKRGLFSVKLMSALYDKVTHLEVDQTFIDRLFFHHGNIMIHTAGGGSIVLKYIDYPIEIKNLLERLINREREQVGLRGVPISTVEGEIIS
ncbi:PH domain-containing protein [Candidatus Daviesbacteria bacterium]|nr:PH domain-containing protein [Candidatus Daviesbacteria bacterium]MBI4035348.1 PH domain-containing protein [Candidatus Daviesbacteria bacterium]